MLPFTMAELREAVNDGDVTARSHPTLPYTIYNYSADVQYRHKWNAVTLNCRGLILDNEGRIVARPWKKFFNLGQVDLPIQLTDPVEVMDKADGSLGILYPSFHPEGFDVVWNIATRGSFASEQAIHATKVMHERYHNIDPMPGYTMLFEIIYPENRIVLNYDGMDDLMLLGAVENATGYYVGPNVARGLWTERGHLEKKFVEWPGPVVKVFEHKNISEANAQMERENAEGYVIRSHNFMVKLKQPDYLDLHRLVTNMTPKVIWEKLRDGMSVSQICAELPDEFHSMAEGFANPLIEKFHERVDEILDGYSSAMKTVHTRWADPSRKDIASVFVNMKDTKYFFRLLDGGTINDLLWSELKPKETKNEYV